MGIFLWKIGSFCLLARRPLISKISALQFASIFLKNAHYRNYLSHLSGFCGFACNFISLRSFTKGCVDNFDWMGLMRRVNSF
jgi:hypothetical protein